MNLHDAMRSDAAEVFFNPEEFAQEMRVNGLDVPGIWDDTLRPLDESSRDTTGWGIAAQTRVLFLPESFACPLPDEELDVDGERYSVLKAEPQEGVLRLELERLTA